MSRAEWRRWSEDHGARSERVGGEVVLMCPEHCAHDRREVIHYERGADGQLVMPVISEGVIRLDPSGVPSAWLSFTTERIGFEAFCFR